MWFWLRKKKSKRSGVIDVQSTARLHEACMRLVDDMSPELDLIEDITSVSGCLPQPLMESFIRRRDRMRVNINFAIDAMREAEDV